MLVERRKALQEAGINLGPSRSCSALNGIRADDSVLVMDGWGSACFSKSDMLR